MATAFRVRRPLVRAVGTEEPDRQQLAWVVDESRRPPAGIRSGGRAGLGRPGPDLHLHGRPLHQLHHHAVAEAAVSVGAGRRRRTDPAVAAARRHHAARAGGLLRHPRALPRVHPLRAQHQLAGAADQWPDPAHLLARHRLRPLPDGEARRAAPDRPAVPGLRPVDPGGLPARDLRRPAADQRCRAHGAVQARASTRTTCATSCSTIACGRSSSRPSPPASPSATRCSASSGWSPASGAGSCRSISSWSASACAPCPGRPCC